jgi:ribosomal 30S subunit maturation factor RimM
VLIDAGALPPAPSGELYTYKLIGCRVELPSGEAVGEVREIWETPAHALLVVAGNDGRDRLIPLTAPLTRQVDVAARRIVIDDRPGLTDPI